MKVAIVHDDLVQWGGAERVLEGICRIFPEAPIYTSVFDRSNLELNKRFGSKKITTSFLQDIPGWKFLYKTLLPFYPIAFEQFNFDEYDLVISHTTRFAKAIITKPQTKHVCYCHTPPRFLWHLSGYGNSGLSELLMTKLRIYDQVSAKRVDLFIAGSENAKRRIKKIYRVDAKVVYPFIDLERFKDIESFDGGYFLVVGRPKKYKRIDLAQVACQKMGVELKVISGGFSDERLVQILAGAKALIVPGEEDFGLVSLEAQALGKPVIAARIGGSLETVIDGKTGLFFTPGSEDSLMGMLESLQSAKIKPADCRENAARFGFDNFMKTLQKFI